MPQQRTSRLTPVLIPLIPLKHVGTTCCSDCEPDNCDEFLAWPVCPTPKIQKITLKYIYRSPCCIVYTTTHLYPRTKMASAVAGPSTSQHVMSVLQTLYVDPDPGAKKRAGEWLEEFQHSVSWCTGPEQVWCHEDGGWRG